jgi:hypothetical protein
LCADVGKKSKAEIRRSTRYLNRALQQAAKLNQSGLCDESETQKKAVDCTKLKLQKWKEDKPNKWKEEKQKQKLVKKASEKPAFKCGIVDHKVGSPYLNISNMYKKMSSIPAQREGQKYAHESCTKKKSDLP